MREAGLCIMMPAACAALAAVLSSHAHAMQPPPPPLGIPELKGLIGRAELIVVGEVREAKETEELAGETKTVGTYAVIEITRVMKGKYAAPYLLIAESATAPGSTRFQCTPAPGEDQGKVIVGRWAGPAQYRGAYGRGSRIIALLVPAKVGGAWQPLGSGTYNEHLGEFLLENNAVRAANSSFEAGLERYARSEDAFMGLVAALVKERGGL